MKFWKPKNILRLEGDKPAIAATMPQHSRRRAPHGVGAVPAARRLRARCGATPTSSWRSTAGPTACCRASCRRVPETARRAAERLMVPGPAQPDHADAAGHGAAGAVRGAVRVELAERVGHGVPARRASPPRSCCASVPERVVKAYVDTFKQLKLAMLTIASMLGLAVPDELLGHDVDAGAGAGRRPAASFRSSAPSSAGSACS